MPLNKFLNKINKIFILKNALLLIAITLVISCSDEGCVEADDFGDIDSQTLTVYSNVNQNSCDYDSSISYENQTSLVLVSCLTTSRQDITISDGSLITSSTGCNGLNNSEAKEVCRQKCISECQENFSANSSSEPSWVSTKTKTKSSSSGVNISPNSEITITAKGALTLGSNVTLSNKFVNFKDLMPNSYGNSTFLSQSVMDVGSGQSISLKFSKSSGAKVEDSPAILSDFDFAKRLVAYIIPHPANYKYNYSEANPTNAVVNVPLTPRFNGWKCLYTSTNLVQSSCSLTDDNYSSDPNSLNSTDLYPNANDSASSSSFDVGSNAKKIIDYGGFIRWDNDKTYNYSYNPFANTNCYSDGLCDSLPDSKDGIIIGDISSDFTFYNNDGNAKELSFKLIGGFCQNLTISRLSIFDKTNREIYYINNFQVNGTYSPNKIPFNQGYKLVITSNLNNYNSTNCGKFLAMRMLKYQDIVINRSGFISLRIVDNNTSESNSPTCNISARIINPKGIHNVINDSATLSSQSIYQRSSSAINLPVPPAGISANVTNSYYGAVTLNNNGTNFVTGDSSCYQDINGIISDTYTDCITNGQSTCMLSNSDARLLQLSQCSTGNGSDGSKNSNPSGGGSGGGGGGNKHGQSYILDSASFGKGGQSGNSYYSDYYNQLKPTLTTISTFANGSGGLGGFNAQDGQVNIYNCDVSCPPTTFNYNSSNPYFEYNVPASQTIRYEIVGGGGGGGGNNCGTSSIVFGATGANSIKFSGVFKNVSSSTTSKLRIYVGGGGSAGYSNCSNSNYINKVAYNNDFSSTSQNISLSAAPSQNISKIRFASYGYPVIKNRSTETSSASDVSKFEINPFCHSRASKVVAVDTCIGKNNCSINLADSTFNSLDTSNCKNGNGSNGESNTSTDNNNGSGGGGGGGNGSGGSTANIAEAGIISGGTAVAPGGAGTSSDSYYDPAYHSTAPSILSSANAGSPSIIAGDGSVKIIDGESVFNYTTPGTFYKNASSGFITYELKGAGGGAGGNYDPSKQGGTGASGSKLSGSITVNSGDQIRIDVGEKGQKGAGACLTPPPYFYNEGTTINLTTLMSGNVVSSSFYGTAQRQSDTSYVSNSYCNIDTKSVINAQLTNSAFLVSSASLGTPTDCSSGDGSSASTAISLTNAGGGGGGGGGNGFETSGIINAGSVAINTVGGAGNSAESFYNAYYSSIPISISSANGANTSSTTAKDGLAILKATSATADASAYVNLNSAQSETYTATADGTIYYKIRGAGGGKGDKNLSTQTVNPGNGAPGNELTGSLNVRNGDIIKVFVGKAGTNGASCTNNSYFNYANEFSKLTFDTPFAITGINFANYGTPNISSTPYTANASCSLDVKANSLITACINQKTCTIYATNLTFGSNPCPPTATQNQYAVAGTNYTGNTNYHGGGGGGGGGGSYIATAGGSASPGFMSGKGETGPSYFNPTYISATPTINSSGGAGGSKGKGYSPGPSANGGAGGNGSIEICNSDGSSNCIVYNTPGVYEATIPSDAKFYFKVKGGGGGGGSPNISAKSPVGGTGANGSYVFGIAQNSLTADNKIYVYVGGGGGGGVASKTGSRTGGSPTTTSLYFLGAKGGDATQTLKGTGGGGGSASFIVYNGQLIVLASGGGGGGGGGEEQSAYSYVNGEDATSNTTLNNTGASFIYTLKKLAIEAISSNSSTKGIGGYVPAYQTSYLTNILSGGDGSETKSGANCVGGGGGGGGGGTMITINDEVAVISGGGGGGGGINSSNAPGNNASANTIISTTLKVAPAKKKLVINYSPNIAAPDAPDAPTPSANDTLLLGGDGGAINKSSSSYCSNNSNGQGGSGGGGTMLSINNRVIAIAGGGGGGGGASINDTELTTKNATNSNNILDKLKAGPFGKYMAVALEYRSGSSGIINITQQSTGDLSIPALPANGVINDIAFASFGENSTSPFYYAGNCSKEENLKTALETNCLFRNSCINTIAISPPLKNGLSCTPSTNFALAKLTYHTPNQSSTQAKDNLILKGGNGGALGSSECSGGGGSGGGASAISVLTNSDFTSASEHFIAIAGGGGGGGGASCDVTTPAIDANGISQNTQTDLINDLNNTSLGKWLTTNVSFPRYTPRVIPEDFYEYDDFSITDNNSSDPLKSFNVNTSGFTPFLGSDLRRDKVFVRKGQIIRFSPKSWDSNWRTKNNLDRQCGIGMAIQVEPRPALICVGKRIQKFLNPNCLQNIDLTSSTSITQNGCKPDNSTASSICNDTTKLCTGDCYKKIVCRGTPSEGNLFSRSPCVVSSEPETAGATCSANGPVNNPANCTTCNEARRVAAELPYYISGNYDNCFDLEDYEGKIYNVIANASDESKINDLINNKKLKVLSGFNGLYGNFENYNVISSNNFETKYPITTSVKGRMKFMIVDGYDLNIPNVAGASYTDFYDNNTGYATIAPSISLNGRNGEWLEIKLCKETSGYDCKSLSITPLADLSTWTYTRSLSIPTLADLSTWIYTPNPSIIKITPQSQVSFDSVNYAFDSNGMLTRITDPIARDCTLATAQSQFGSSPTTALFDPNSAVITSKSSKFYCHTDQTSQSNLRLSFKIFDPEYLDCNLSNGSSTAPLNGVKINNLKYSVGPGNDGNTCSQTESVSNNCVKQFSCVDRYSNNSGSYEVKIKVKNSRGISQIVNNIVQPVLYWMDGNSASSIPSERIGIVEGIYKSLISNPKYKLILKLSLSIFVMFYGLGYLMGVSELSQAEVVTRIFKIGFIYIFVGENGWLWFKEIFVNIFKEGVIQASFLMASSFDNSLQLETAINTGNYQNTALLFGSVDKVISILFSSAINKKIWAFLFTGIFGWAYVLVFYFSILNYIYALSNAVLLFITAQIMISILFVIGPIFFIFLLFNQTKDMFDNWLKALVGFGLQLIFLITTLTFFNLLMVEVLKMALGYKACWDDAWVINLGSRVTLTQFWTIPTLPPRTNMAEDLMNTGSPDSIPSFFSIIYIWVIASLTTKMVTFMTDAASTISEGIKASQIGGGIKQTASFLKQGLQGFAQSQIWDRTAGRALDTLDNKLFASGKTAKKERQENRRQASEDMSNRRSLVKAADKAEENFKKNPENINAFAKKNPETQKEIVKQIRQEAMEKRGEALGLNKADVRRISSGSGLKYYGTNVFGATLQGMKQGIFKGGALFNPIKDKYNNKISRKDAENAMKDMDKKDREQFIEGVKDGKINVARTLTERLKTNPLKAGKRGIKAIARRINDNFNPLFNKDYKNAALELQNEGKIIPDLYYKGRSDKEKALIRDRVAQNRDKAKRTGKKTVAKKLLNKFDINAKKKLKMQKDNLGKLLDENSDRTDLEELDEIVNDAQDIIDSDDDGADNAKEVLEQFVKIDNLKDEGIVRNFLKQDNVKNIMKKSDV